MIQKILLLISSLAFLSCAYADDPCQSVSGPYGPMVCTAGMTNTVFANGPVTMKDTVVSGSTKINGSLDAVNVQFGKKKRNTLNTEDLLLDHKSENMTASLTVNGKVQLKDATVYGDATINGFLAANKTIFMGTLTVASNEIQLTNCNTNAIVIKGSNGDGVVSPQTVSLSGYTHVNGNITFKQAGGIVYLGANANITGKVISGEIIAAKASPASKMSTTKDNHTDNKNSVTKTNIKNQIANVATHQS